MLMATTVNGLVHWLGIQQFVSVHAGDVLIEFFKLCCRKETTEEIFGRGLAEEEGKGRQQNWCFSPRIQTRSIQAGW